MTSSQATLTAAHWLALAEERLALGDDDGAERAYIGAMQFGENFDALNGLGLLAYRRGRRTAARLAHERSFRLRPDSPIAHVNLGNILFDDDQKDQARAHYLAALDADPGFAPAHRGLARLCDAEGDARALEHWRLADEGGRQRRPKRGVGPGLSVLLIASVRLGNMPISPWLDDGLFDAHVVEVEHFPVGAPLPPHALVLNLIADADLCADALPRAAEIAAMSDAPLLNSPARVAATGRLDIARRLGTLADVETSVMRLTARAELLVDPPEAFPLLLRAPGFHAGRHFVRVERREDLRAAIEELPGEDVIVMSVLDARGSDGYHRKYRALSIAGRWLPLHLAASPDWKVHYFSAGMGSRAEHREEERRYLEDMPRALGARACAALEAIAEIVGLDYFGVDFALAPDGRLLLFEANAAMVILDPPDDPIWDYRRAAIAEARAAARAMTVNAALRGARRP